MATPSTDISTSRAFVQERTEKTRAVQVAISDDVSWTWPEKSVSEWDADLLSLDATVDASLAKVARAAEVDMLAARGLLDARLDAIHKETLLTVGVMRVRAAKLPGLREIAGDLSARGDSRRTIEDEADDLTAAWEEWEEQTGTIFTPAPGKTLVSFKELTEGLTGSSSSTQPALGILKKNYKLALAKWRRSEGYLNALYSRLEDECIAWYAEATKVFPEGTPQGDLIREQVPTDYNPPTPAPPAPTPPGP